MAKKHETKKDTKINTQKDFLIPLVIVILVVQLLLSIFIVIQISSGSAGVSSAKIDNINSKVNAIDSFFRNNIQGYANSTTAANTTAAATNTGTASASSADTSIFAANPSLFPSVGPANATNTVVELADFQCPYCALASGLPAWASQYQNKYGDLIDSAGKAEALAKQGGNTKFVFVPLSFLGQESVNAAQAAFCAENQGKFFQMHDAIYAASTGPQEDTGKYSIPNLEKIAAGISGIDTAKFNSCLQTNQTLPQVQKVMTLVQNAGFQISTPQFWVNGKQINPSWAAIQAALK